MCWVIAAHHVPDVNTEMNFFARNMGPVLVVAAVGWLMYTALEPYVRRFWPDGILGWTRLMSGHIRDPRVGRDVLIGCAIAVGLALAEALYHLLPPLFGRPSQLPTFQSNVAALAGGGTLVSMLYDQGVVSGTPVPPYGDRRTTAAPCRWCLAAGTSCSGVCGTAGRQ